MVSATTIVIAVIVMAALVLLVTLSRNSTPQARSSELYIPIERRRRTRR